jgi:hypothetical protein
MSINVLFILFAFRAQFEVWMYFKSINIDNGIKKILE